MNNKRKCYATILSFDLDQEIDDKGWHWIIRTYVSTGDSYQAKRWTNRSGRLSPEQALDLSTWMSDTAQRALAGWGSIQGVPAEAVHRSS